MMRYRFGQLILKRVLVWVLVSAALVGCGAAPADTAASASRIPGTRPITTSVVPPPVTPWIVGGMPLPRRKDGLGVVRSTPPALQNRRIATVDRLPPPTSISFQSTIGSVTPQVLARSTWKPNCPVKPDQLRYLTMSFRGFDARPHTGEMLVNAEVAQTVVGVFKRLFAAGFPMEEMRITSEAEMNLPPTGDGNNTEAFVCRPTRGQKQWSAHAYGLAIDLNPFNNPYVKGDLVLPELASSYLDREWVRSGMALEGGPVVTVFESVGWTWGGRWSDPVDFMHFSANGH